MFYIKLDSGMNLVVTSREPLYRGDHLSQKLTFLIPTKIGDLDMASATLYLSYIRADGTADIDLLKRGEELYNESYYQFTMPVTSKLTRYAGPVTTFLTIYSGAYNRPRIAKSGEFILHIQASTNMDDVITDQHLSLIYSMQRQMEDKVEKAEATLTERIDRTDEAVAAKADNIVFNEEDSTIQLVSTVEIKDEEGNPTGEFEKIPLGDPIFVRAETARGIINMEINEDGELVVTFDDETTQNLCLVVGKNGSVYVPHVDEHKVLTFTIDSEPGEVPEPVDLNPNDEWSDMGDGGMDEPGGESTYVWEDM